MASRVHIRDQAGSVSTAVGLIGLLITVAITLVGVGAGMVTHRHVSNAADLAALAAATAIQNGHSPCAVAAQIAERNRVQLTSCERLDQRVSIVVVRSLRLGRVEHQLQGRASAGPVG